MSKIYILAAALCLGGCLILGYQAISSMMTPGDIIFENLTIANSLDEEHLEWVDELSSDFLHRVVVFFIETPIYIMLIFMGVLVFIYGGIKSR